MPTTTTVPFPCRFRAVSVPFPCRASPAVAVDLMHRRIAFGTLNVWHGTRDPVSVHGNCRQLARGVPAASATARNRGQRICGLPPGGVTGVAPTGRKSTSATTASSSLTHLKHLLAEGARSARSAATQRTVLVAARRCWPKSCTMLAEERSSLLAARCWPKRETEELREAGRRIEQRHVARLCGLDSAINRIPHREKSQLEADKRYQGFVRPARHPRVRVPSLLLAC